jgi:hypothetical protein
MSRALLLLPVTALLALACPPARAEVVRLRTGEAVKGQIVKEQSNLKILVVEDYMSGRLRQFVWEVVDPSDRQRLRTLLGYENQARGTVKGLRVTIRLAGDQSDEVVGIKVREDDQSLTILSNGQELKIAKSAIIETFEEDMDPRDVYAPDQLYRKLEDDWRARTKAKGEDPDNPTVQDHWLLGDDAEWAGALEKARDHYRACAEAPDFLQKNQAADRLARVEALLRDQAALATLRDARVKLSSALFRNVRAILDGFPAKHPEASESVQKALEKAKASFAAKRTAYFQTMARNELPKIAERLIEEKVKEKDVTLSDATGWTRRQLPDLLFQALGTKMTQKDDVTPEEARTFWEGRRKIGWIRKSYGAGTFVQYPPKIKPPTQRSNPSGGQNRPSGGSQGPAPVFQPPKPPTKDQWWAAARASERTQFLMAWFGQNSGLFDVDEDLEYRPCILCHGVGLLSKTFQSGAKVDYLCTRCGGARNDVTVKFR